MDIQNIFKILTSISKKQLIPIIVASVLISIIVIVLIIVFSIKAKHTRLQSQLSEETKELADKICSALGTTNITQIKLKNSRLELVVGDSQQINKELLISCNVGASLTGNIIKLIIKDNAELLEKQIKKIREGSTIK